MNLLSLLNENEKKYLEIRKYEKGKTIFLENTTCNHIGFILNGEILITSFLLSGKEIIYQHIIKDGCFGNNLLFSSSNNYKGDIIAYKDSTIALILKENFIKILNNNKLFLEKYLELISNNSLILNQKIKLLSLDSAIDRVLYYLHINNDKISFKSISNLAKELSLTRECLSRTLKKLVNLNKIKIDNKIILICQK